MSKPTDSPRIPVEESAGRAAGYCWAEHPKLGLHCTRPPHHPDAHKHYYRRVEWPQSPTGPAAI